MPKIVSTAGLLAAALLCGNAVDAAPPPPGRTLALALGPGRTALAEWADIRVTGTVTSADPRRSIALVSVGEGTAYPVFTGEAVGGAWTLVAIDRAGALFADASGLRARKPVQAGAGTRAAAPAQRVPAPPVSVESPRPGADAVERAWREFMLPARD